MPLRKSSKGCLIAVILCRVQAIVSQVISSSPSSLITIVVSSVTRPTGKRPDISLQVPPRPVLSMKRKANVTDGERSCLLNSDSKTFADSSNMDSISDAAWKDALLFLLLLHQIYLLRFQHLYG
ncbi:hypothetical protein Ahy_B08g090497 [Arachis hypogaea]|uniref:Uncharacterized protein n=1 Tax=Arachis hypogaea TaxID=3818 RepID=A0A444Y081_ARAHY|nr:hypothetical protein Ahy_B08g090497 [Arachis hypogaea]